MLPSSVKLMRTLRRYTAVGRRAGSASKHVPMSACNGAGRPSGRGGACLATPTAVHICISVSCCQGGEPVIMCSRVAAKPQISTLLVVRQPGANCSGALYNRRACAGTGRGASATHVLSLQAGCQLLTRRCAHSRLLLYSNWSHSMR